MFLMVYCNAKQANGGEQVNSFEMLYRAYYDRVYAFLHRLCGDRALAEDLAQETFLQAYKIGRASCRERVLRLV